MAKPEYVHLLINSLTKSEKRFFKLFSQSTGGKDYLLLYELMLKSKIESKGIKEEFLKKKPNANFNVTCQHLYNAITRCLIFLESNKDIENLLMNRLLEAKVLFSRDVYEESLNVIRKTKALALNYEKFHIYLLLSRLELQYLSQLEYSDVDENYIVKVHSKIEQISRQQRAIDNHYSLYEVINYRRLNQGVVGNSKDKERLNDLVFNEIQARSLTRKESFEAQKLHLLFQSAYFMLTVNHKSSLKVYTELNNLFEENRAIWGQPPVLYLQHLRGILNNLRIMGKYDEMQFFIGKAKQINTHTKSSELFSNQLVFLFESLMYTDNLNFTEAQKHLKKEGGELIIKSQMLPMSLRAELMLQVSIINFGNEKFHDALKVIRPFLNMGKNFLSLPIIKMIRMFQLIIHFEMKHYDYLEYEIKSQERDLKQKNKLQDTEKLLFRFIRQYISAVSNKDKLIFVHQFLNEPNISQNPQYDFQLFGNFRFTRWLEGISH